MCQWNSLNNLGIFKQTIDAYTLLFEIRITFVATASHLIEDVKISICFLD